MDFAAMLKAVKELVTSEGAQTRQDIMLHVTEQMGKMQGQLDQTNYRITDLSQQLSDRIAETNKQLGERIAEMSSQLGERIAATNQRITETNQQLGQRISDLNVHVIDLGRRMDEGFAEERRQRERGILALEQRIDRLAQTMAPKTDQESLARRVDKLEREVEEMKHRSPDEAA